MKTLKKIFGQKIDRIERPTSDDRHLGNDFGTPEFSANSLNLEFSHRLAAKRIHDFLRYLPSIFNRITKNCVLPPFLRAFRPPLTTDQKPVGNFVCKIKKFIQVVLMPRDVWAAAASQSVIMATAGLGPR